MTERKTTSDWSLRSGWDPMDSPPGWTCPECDRELGGHRHACDCGYLVTDL